RRETGAIAGIVCVSSAANGQVGLMAVEAGFHILTETPIAKDLLEADAIVAAAEERGLHVEVSEQFHRRPVEQIKLALIASGVFGTIYSSMNDYVGHGYHGVSVMRSYLGFDARPIRVIGSVHDYHLEPHRSTITGDITDRSENHQHGIVEFDDGRTGVFHWTSVGYDSSLRWWRASRFYGEKGMGVMYGTFSEPITELTLIGPDRQGFGRITLHRELERCDGGALVRMIAYTGLPDLPVVEWRNPFGSKPGGWNPQWHDDEIGVAGCIKSLVDAIRGDRPVTYGARQALLEQEITLAISRSAKNGNQPVDLPLPR
ncbi:MAG: Gfo/Idh/MocA family oxidoreductase, partial [Spirochaetales bacterium]